MNTKIIAQWAGMMLLPAALLALSSCSSPSQNQTASTAMGEPSGAAAGPSIARGGIVLNALTGTATVKSIDAETRTVVLEHPDGTTTSYECGPEVRNFDQIKVGDQVNATVANSVAIVLIKGGVPPAAGTATAIVRAPLGAKPGGRIVDTVGFTARVVSLDPTTREVTLQTPDGTNRTVKVGPDVDLTGVNPGDDVGVKLTRAIAISVTTPEE